MKLRGIYAGRPALFQLALLIGLTLAGTLVSGVITLVFDLEGGTQSPETLRLIQTVSAICVFLAPAVLVALLCSKEPAEYLSVRSFPTIEITLLTFAGVLLLSPTITLTGVLNEGIKLPPFLEQLEEEIEQLTTILLSDTGVMAIIFNLLVIAVLAAITEEFFFRGVLQQIVGRWIRNHHVVIWSVAFIFSAIHFQFSGLIPRLLLGAYLGYLLYWSKNIWLPILAHFCNNALAVIGMADSDLRENSYISGKIPESEMLVFVGITILTFILFCYVTYLFRKRILRD
ncbi:MAG: CPBP family intramembrane metalloprotease [Tannerellaceae bacterium]|jgi:membrane protease YdiL (CAAX protease family)|nr:CPBP family intramembrane metalloprotease [Tannerellaceae bacterium]